MNMSFIRAERNRQTDRQTDRQNDRERERCKAEQAGYVSSANYTSEARI